MPEVSSIPEDQDTAPRLEGIAFLWRERSCCPTAEELERVAGMVEQDAYNCFEPEQGAFLEKMRTYLLECAKTARAHGEIFPPFSRLEIEDTLDWLRMCYPNWADDTAIVEYLKATEDVYKGMARHPDVTTTEERMEEIAEFFDAFCAVRGWCRTGSGCWEKREF